MAVRWRTREGTKISGRGNSKCCTSPRRKRVHNFLESERGSASLKGGAQGWFWRGKEGPDYGRWGRSRYDVWKGSMKHFR